MSKEIGVDVLEGGILEHLQSCFRGLFDVWWCNVGRGALPRVTICVSLSFVSLIGCVAGNRCGESLFDVVVEVFPHTSSRVCDGTSTSEIQLKGSVSP